MLSQFLVLFGFFSLVLVSVYWINQAVRLFDRLVGGGHSAFVFLEFTALTLPNVIRLVLPMSAFAGAVYVTNRLSQESELVVMQSTGFSPWRLARPALYYGLIVAGMMMILTHVLVPASRAQLAEREREVTQNVTAKLLTEGTFLHPTDGVTFYIREITPQGALQDVYLSDRRNPERAMTYTASEAYLVKTDDARTQLVMIDGMSQTLMARGERLFTTRFSDFSYDISALIVAGGTVRRSMKHVGTLEALRDPAAIAAETGNSIGAVVEHAHSRFTQPLLAIMAVLIGFSALLVGGFSRFGVWRQIILALLLLVFVKLVEGLVSDPVTTRPDLWPLTYLPAVVGAGIAALLLWWAGRTRRRRPAAQPLEGAA